MSTPEYLTINDLKLRVGNEIVVSYFDDDNTGSLSASELLTVDDIMAAAEAEAFSRLRKAYSADQIIDLANNDAALKSHVAWIALELAAERRPVFLSDDGRGPYWAQYERAMKYCDMISKGSQRSHGESVAGVTEQIGGMVQPTVQSGSSVFIFAPDTNSPTGHGGF